MAKKFVNINVDVNGKTNIEAEGFSGGECIDATQAFESMFSKVERGREMTGECRRPDDGERVKV